MTLKIIRIPKRNVQIVEKKGTAQNPEKSVLNKPKNVQNQKGNVQKKATSVQKVRAKTKLSRIPKNLS